MKVILFLIIVTMGFSESLPIKDQARLMKMLIAASGKSFHEVRLGIVGGSEEQVRELQNYLGGEKIKLKGEAGVPLNMVMEPKEEDLANLDVVYVFGNSPLVSSELDVISFADAEDAVRQGALVGLLREGVQPRILMNLNTLKRLSLKYPSSLLKMVTLVKE